MNPTKQVSPHLVAVYQALTRASGWLTNDEIAQEAGVAPRTTRAHTARLCLNGVAESMTVFGGGLFRLRQDPTEKARAYRARIEEAAAALVSPKPSHGYLHVLFLLAKSTKEKRGQGAIVGEALECLRQALTDKRPEQDKARIRAWIADLAGDATSDEEV